LILVKDKVTYWIGWIVLYDSQLVYCLKIMDIDYLKQVLNSSGT